MSISAVILTKNEEENISACLKSLSWCDEMVVVDDDSTDRTVKIAKSLNAHVHEHVLHEDFASQRNFGLEKARGDWVLFVDADERVSEKLQKEILEGMQENRVDGYLIKRVDNLWGRVLKHGEQGDMWLLRLARKGHGEWKGKVHEVWKITGKIARLHNSISHFPHQTIAGFLRKINFYSTLRAKELHAQNVQTNWLDILIHAKGKFAEDYWIKMGFLDGTAGFVVAICMSFHAFLVRGKLWQLLQK